MSQSNHGSCIQEGVLLDTGKKNDTRDNSRLQRMNWLLTYGNELVVGLAVLRN